AFAASVDRVKRLGLSMAQADFHSLSWLHYEYLQQGRLAKARELEQIVRDAIAAIAGPAKAGLYRFDAAMPRDASIRTTVGSGFSRASQAGGHQHAESEIGRGFGATSLKSELGSMRARRIVESGAWEEMKGQGSFENIDE